MRYSALIVISLLKTFFYLYLLQLRTASYYLYFGRQTVKKFALAVGIFFLVLSTAIIKNTTKQIEDEIFTAKENIRILKTEFENVSLEYDYLSSSEKLLEYQSQYFEDELIQKNINDIKVYNISNDLNKIQNFKIIKE